MTRIILVRHGETEWNKKRWVQGSTDIELSDVGRSQARKLAQALKNIPIDHIYSSPQKRARETAEIIAQNHPYKPFTARQDLAEYMMGTLEGMALDDISKKYPGTFDWDNDEFRYKIGAESFVNMVKHFHRYLPALFRQHDGQTILLSTHGGKKKTMLYSLFPSGETYQHIKKTHPTNCSLTEITWDAEKGAQMIRYSDDTHLQPKR